MGSDEKNIEIEIDCLEQCINCSARFWALEKPVAFCVFCDMLERTGEI